MTDHTHNASGLWQPGSVPVMPDSIDQIPKPIAWRDVAEELSRLQRDKSTHQADSGGQLSSVADDVVFGLAALHDPIRLCKCVHCGKTVLEEALVIHLHHCPLRGDRMEDGFSTPPDKLSSDSPNSDDAGMGPNSLKRKPASPLQLTSRPFKVRRTIGYRTKSYVRSLNLDEMCGVLTSGNMPCRRCLTCKQHSVGAKRNVLGRSQPFDVLVANLKKGDNDHVERPESDSSRFSRKESGPNSAALFGGAFISTKCALFLARRRESVQDVLLSDRRVPDGFVPISLEASLASLADGSLYVPPPPPPPPPAVSMPGLPGGTGGVMGSISNAMSGAGSGFAVGGGASSAASMNALSKGAQSKNKKPTPPKKSNEGKVSQGMGGNTAAGGPSTWNSDITTSISPSYVNSKKPTKSKVKKKPDNKDKDNKGAGSGKDGKTVKDNKDKSKPKPKKPAKKAPPKPPGTSTAMALGQPRASAAGGPGSTYVGNLPGMMAPLPQTAYGQASAQQSQVSQQSAVSVSPSNATGRMTQQYPLPSQQQQQQQPPGPNWQQSSQPAAANYNSRYASTPASKDSGKANDSAAQVPGVQYGVGNYTNVISRAVSNVQRKAEYAGQSPVHSQGTNSTGYTSSVPPGVGLGGTSAAAMPPNPPSPRNIYSPGQAAAAMRYAPSTR